MDSNKKQTAVEFLVKEFSSILGPIKTTPIQDLLLVDAINKAKELEKQHHEETWYDSTLQFDNASKMTNKKLFEDYYTETYGGNNG